MKNVKDIVVYRSYQTKVNSVDHSTATSDEVASNLWAITPPVLNPVVTFTNMDNFNLSMDK